MQTGRRAVVVNGRDYAWPAKPLVVICCDGSEPAYMEQAMARGLMPNLELILAKGTNLTAASVIPSFTNPNNLSIVTGAPPAVHGICGNYFFDRDSGEEVLMNDPKFLRAPTIFEAFQRAGARVAVVTAKDKLRGLLGNKLKFDGTAVSFSSEKADQCTLADHGIEAVLDLVAMPLPDVYSLELSEFVFAAGVKLLARFKPDLMYLSTTDYIQHKFAPGTDGANAFYAMMDRYLGELDRAGAVIVLTADHGMKPKHGADGAPDVFYLQDFLDDLLGKGAARVILPITDPYVVHHGALGSFATAYLPDGASSGEVIGKIAAEPGMHEVLGRDEACARYELPPDRIGDIVVVSRDTKVIGTSVHRHDLAALREPLRSHGGITEQVVPMIVNRRLNNVPDRLRNFDAFAIGLNHLADAGALQEV
jgi:phosphonoacetate hydrolase